MSKEKVPELDDKISLDRNFEQFFSWAQDLEDPVGYVETYLSGSAKRDHAIGFACYYLARSELYVARLHHYARAAQIEKDIHDHVFDFKSGVLAGTLIQTLYDLEQSDAGLESLLCFDDASGIQQVEPTQLRYNVNPNQVQHFESGSVYSMHPGTIHSVAVADNTITLMVKTNSIPYQKALVIKH